MRFIHRKQPYTLCAFRPSINVNTKAMKMLTVNEYSFGKHGVNTFVFALKALTSINYQWNVRLPSVDGAKRVKNYALTNETAYE